MLDSGLLPKSEVKRIISETPRHLVCYQEAYRIGEAVPPFDAFIHNQMKILYAELETRHFTFRCVALTKSNSIDGAAKRDIETTVRRGLCWHCEQVGVDPDKLLKYVAAGDCNIHLLEQGVLYRDCGR